MELWIRSQSKEKLVKIENIYISDEIRDGRAIMGCNSAFINQDLGTYATKERALEILDEIENFKDALTIINLSDKKNDLIIATVEKLNSFTYKMPKE